MWKSFLEVVRFILTKFDPVSSHGDPVRAKSYLFLTHLGWLAGLAGWLGWLAGLVGWLGLAGLAGWFQICPGNQLAWLAGFKFARGTSWPDPGEPGRATASSSPLSYCIRTL